MKKLKELRAFEAIALALIIVEILNKTSSMFLISSKFLMSKGFDGPGVYLIISVITALSPIVILYLIYDYIRKNARQRYSPGMNLMIAGSIVLLMSVRGFAKFPEQLYDISKFLTVLADHQMLRTGMIFNGLEMALTVVGFVIALMMIRRGYELVHGVILSETLLKTSEFLQITLPVGFGVLVLTLFEKGESIVSVFIPWMIYDQMSVNSGLYWTTTEAVLSIVLIFAIVKYCKTAAVQKDVKRESFLFAGGILVIYEVRNSLFYLPMSFSLINNLINDSGNDIELIPITLNSISLLFFIMKMVVGIWYLRHSNRDDTGYEVMP